MRAKMIDPKTGEIVWASDAEPLGSDYYIANIYNDPYGGKLIGHVEWPVSDEWKEHKTDPKTGKCVVPNCYGFCDDDSNACDWNDENASFYYDRNKLEYKELLNKWFGAAEKGSIDNIKELHEEDKIDLDEVNELNGYTALIIACNHGWNLVIEYLISKGANINAQSKEDGFTPLICACRSGNDLSIVKLLIEKGANIEVKDKQGWTALSAACSFDSDFEKYNIVEYLVSKGADIHAKSHKTGINNLMLACLDDRFETIKLLVSRGININERASGGRTALMFACAFSSIGVVKYLVNHKADVNLINSKDGSTALMEAAEKNNLEIVQFLLLCGANSSIKDSKGQLAEDKTTHSSIQKLIHDWGMQDEGEI